MIFAWVGSWLGLFFLLWGHHGIFLSPIQHGISTYAARAPRGLWVKTGLGLWGVVFGWLGWILFSRVSISAAFFIAGGTFLGTVGFGWILLFNETVGPFRHLFAASPQAVYEQTYHNAGVQLNALGILIVLLAWAWDRGVLFPMVGWVFLSQILRHAPWVRVMGWTLEESRGLRQRVEVGMLFLALQAVILWESGIVAG